MHRPETRRATRNLRGALLVSAGVALFGVGDTIVKLVAERHGIPQIMAVRGVTFCLVVLAAMRVVREPLHARAILDRGNLTRAALETLCVVLYLTAITLMPLGMANALILSSPIASAVLAAIVLRERVDLARWAGVATGFLGVVLVTRPAGAMFGWAALLPLGAALAMAANDIVTRRLDPGLGAGSVVLTTGLAIAACGFALALPDWRPMALGDVAALAGAGVILAAAYACYIEGLRIGEISLVGPFKYVGIPCTMLLGFLAWGDVPGPSTLVGSALVVAGGLLVLTGRRRSSTPAASTPDPLSSA
jgi:drug/metabolite transporter (DMT)-like permease